MCVYCVVRLVLCFFFSSRRRHTRCALVTGVQTCALPIYVGKSGREIALDVPKDKACRATASKRRVAGALGFEPRAFGFGDRRSNQLSYAPTPSPPTRPFRWGQYAAKIGRASCRESVLQYV